MIYQHVNVKLAKVDGNYTIYVHDENMGCIILLDPNTGRIELPDSLSAKQPDKTNMILGAAALAVTIYRDIKSSKTLDESRLNSRLVGFYAGIRVMRIS